MPDKNLSHITTAIVGEKGEEIVIFAVINNVKVYQHKTKKTVYGIISSYQVQKNREEWRKPV